MGNSPSLQTSIQKGEWAKVRSILRTEEGRARAGTKAYVVQQGENVTALHLACLHQAPDNILRTLIAVGQPIHASSPCEWTPLHYIMIKKPTTLPRVVRILLEAYPQDVAWQSSRHTGSKTPLHIACEVKAPHGIIQMLHETVPSACHIRDVRGQTPLDVACTHPWLFNPVWRVKVSRILKDEQPIQHNTPPFVAEATPVPNTVRPPPVAEASPVPKTVIPHPGAEAVVMETYVAAPVFPMAPPEIMDEHKFSKMDGKDDCVLCWDQRAEMALVPCGHVCLCSHCCGQTEILNETLHGQCPVCRCAFSQTLKIYQAGNSRA